LILAFKKTASNRGERLSPELAREPRKLGRLILRKHNFKRFRCRQSRKTRAAAGSKKTSKTWCTPLGDGCARGKLTKQYREREFKVP